jgi:light-regulated signal transduction histidine kinase (bacteriophytochrome)
MKLGPHNTRTQTDIPDRNLAEEEIERLRLALDAETERCLRVQRQLAQANTDFEGFVSIAAHHLRESLRNVAANSQLMAETYAGRLDSNADVLLSHIRDGVARMQSLLTGIVEYGVPDTGDRHPLRIDMEAILLLSMDEQLKESRIVSHDPLPVVMGDSEILAKVLKHLIRNAVEYCGTPNPRVHISAKRENLDWVFSVQDNGPGIDPAFHGRIFGVFKRLHGEDYAGAGLGLAFCKKAIEWHGGRMWVESTPGQGSTFYFTLRPADPDVSA